MNGGGGGRQRFRPLAFSAAGVPTPASLVETVLKTYTIPANLLNQDNKRIRALYWGTFGANANAKTVRIRLGTVTLTGTIMFATAATAYNGIDWHLQFDLARRSLDVQDSIANFRTEGAVAANLLITTLGTGALDDAADMLLELTGQNAVAAGGDIVCSGHQIEFIDAP